VITDDSELSPTVDRGNAYNGKIKWVQLNMDAAADQDHLGVCPICAPAVTIMVVAHTIHP
jgi:hypothetical protein